MSAIVICDDSSAWLRHASSIVKEFLEKEGRDMAVLCFDDLERCVGEIREDTAVVFMDIEWEHKTGETGERAGDTSERVKPDGIKAVAEINRRYPDCRVIYLTNYLGYALDVYGTEHAWYVVKDQFEKRLPEIFEKLDRLETEGKASLIVKTSDGAVVSIACGDICYIERRGRLTEIACFAEGESAGSRERARMFEIRDRIPEVLEKLPADSFARCHNSIIVNMEKVSRIHGNSLTMEDGTELLISRGHSRSFRSHFMEWAKGQLL